MDKDDWGLDPNVRAMRRVFSAMESALAASLAQKFADQVLLAP